MDGKSMAHKVIAVLSVIVFIGILTGGTTGQADENQNPADELQKYMPYDLGQWRQYDRSYWSMASGAAWVEEITQTVVGVDEVLDGRDACILKDEGVSYDSIWFVYMDDEVRRYEDYPEDYKDYKVLLKSPVEKGNWWLFNHYPVDGKSLEAHIVDTDATIELYQTTYEHCVHVFAQPYNHYYIKPGIGIVHSSEAKPDSVTGTDDELVNWQIDN